MAQPQQLQKIAEGREAEIFGWQDGAVLRLLRNPQAQRQVEWEAQAMAAARASGVRVPAVLGTVTVEGRPGLIMERVDGPDMLTLLARRPWSVLAVGRASGELQARLHETPAPEGIPDLKATFLNRIPSSDRVPPQLAEFALAELDRLPDGDRICHGDFHPGNLLQTDGEPLLIDWTSVMRGDPAADYCRTDLMIRLGDPPPGTPPQIRVLAAFARGILLTLHRRAYRRVRPLDTDLVRRWEVPVAANRLVDNIEAERPKLLRLLEERRSTG